VVVYKRSSPVKTLVDALSVHPPDVLALIVQLYTVNASAPDIIPVICTKCIIAPYNKVCLSVRHVMSPIFSK